MNRKGQAALEYLMTYGWALIVIAIVVGVLIFIISTPVAGVVCNSSDPTKMILKQYTVTTEGTPREIVLQNATGGEITIASGTPSGDFGSIVELNPAASSTVGGGGSLTISVVDCPDCNTEGNAISGSVRVNYTDQFGYSKDVTITCQGTV